MGRLADGGALAALIALGTHQMPLSDAQAAQAPKSPFIVPAGPQRVPGKR